MIADLAVLIYEYISEQIYTILSIPSDDTYLENPEECDDTY
jgi:hypothetical protein